MSREVKLASTPHHDTFLFAARQELSLTVKDWQESRKRALHNKKTPKV